MSNPKLSDFNFDLDAIRRYEIALKNGTTIKTDGSAEEHARAIAMLDKIDQIGMIEPEHRPLISDTMPPPPLPPTLTPTATAAPLNSAPLPEAIDQWLEQSGAKNETRTVDGKAYHIKDFLRRRFGHVKSVAHWLAAHQNTPNMQKKALLEVEAATYKQQTVMANAVDKEAIVGYKSELLKEGQKAKTIDNKLMTIHNFLKYAIAHGAYTATNENPVSGLFILTKEERKKKTEPYEPFTDEALKTFFDAEKYSKAMTAPDLFWAPLLGIFTGMRISEATQIRTDDVRKTANGLHYIFVPKSKTTAGIRNVPICATLQRLGFLDYVNECRSAGAERIFPHCLLINNSYSKDVSAAMLEHQRILNIKAPHTSFHSFRVNVITAMANNGANTPQVMKIVGHKRSDSDEVHLGYVRDLPDLQPIVDTLKWPIDIPSLAYNGRFGAFVANQDNWAKSKKRKAEAAKDKAASEAS